jgi:hypothetical protein
MLFVLLRRKTLSELLRSFGRYTAVQINKLTNAHVQLWQEGFYDHRCRDVDDALDRLAYIEQNPVRARLVADSAEWPFSSAFPANAYLLDRRWYAEQS